MKNDLEFSVTAEAELLPFLLQNIKKSRNSVKSLLGRGQISVNGKTVKAHDFRLKTGARVTVHAFASGERIRPGMKVIYEDGELIVINKPAGLLPMATDRERENTAYRMVTDYVRTRSGGERVFIVHRLDRETSGVMLFAKNEPLKRALQDNWDELVTRREYIAVAEGVVHPAEGQIKSWLLQTKTLLMYSSETEGDGKLAITNYRTLKNTSELTLLEVTLETGRKNQIRVHLSELGNPVSGDKKYGAGSNALGRLGLHASRLELRHPLTDKELSFSAKTPSVLMKPFTD